MLILWRLGIRQAGLCLEFFLSHKVDLYHIFSNHSSSYTHRKKNLKGQKNLGEKKPPTQPKSHQSTIRHHILLCTSKELSSASTTFQSGAAVSGKVKQFTQDSSGPGKFAGHPPSSLFHPDSKNCTAQFQQQPRHRQRQALGGKIALFTSSTTQIAQKKGTSSAEDESWGEIT